MGQCTNVPIIVVPDVTFICSFINLPPLSLAFFFFFPLIFSMSKAEKIEFCFALSFCGHAERNWKKGHIPQGSATTPE